MDPAPAPTYDAPATRSNKRKENGHVDIEEPIPRKRGPGRPRTKAESKEDVSKSINNELLQKTKRTAQQILDANTKLSSYAEEAFRVGRNVLAIYNMLADNMDDLIGAVEKKEHGDDVKNIIRKVQKTRYDTVINNITPLLTKMEELPALPYSFSSPSIRRLQMRFVIGSCISQDSSRTMWFRWSGTTR